MQPRKIHVVDLTAEDSEDDRFSRVSRPPPASVRTPLQATHSAITSTSSAREDRRYGSVKSPDSSSSIKPSSTGSKSRGSSGKSKKDRDSLRGVILLEEESSGNSTDEQRRIIPSPSKLPPLARKATESKTNVSSPPSSAPNKRAVVPDSGISGRNLQATSQPRLCKHSVSPGSRSLASALPSSIQADRGTPTRTDGRATSYSLPTSGPGISRLPAPPLISPRSSGRAPGQHQAISKTVQSDRMMHRRKDYLPPTRIGRYPDSTSASPKKTERNIPAHYGATDYVKAHVSDSETSSTEMVDAGGEARLRRRPSRQTKDEAEVIPSARVSMDGAMASNMRRKRELGRARPKPLAASPTEHGAVDNSSRTKPGPVLTDANFPVGLSLNEAERILHRHLQQFMEDHDDLLKCWLGRARVQGRILTPSAMPKTSSADHENNNLGRIAFSQQEASPFVTMAPLQSSFGVHMKKGENVENFQQRFVALGKNPRETREFKVTVKAFKSDAISLPSYATYVGLKQNVLIENSKDLKIWPFFHPDSNFQPEDYDKYEADMKGEYPLGNPDDRSPDLQRKERAKQMQPYVLRYLEEAGCTIEDVLRYFLEARNAELANLIPESYRKEWFSGFTGAKLQLTNAKWTFVYSTLPSTTIAAIIKAGLAAAAFQKHTSFYDPLKKTVSDFSLWEFARERALSKAPNRSKPGTNEDPLLTYTSLICEICQIHDCPYHGEYQDIDMIDADAHAEFLPEYELDDQERTNRKIRVNAPHRDSPIEAENLCYFRSASNNGELEDGEVSESSDYSPGHEGYFIGMDREYDEITFQGSFQRTKEWQLEDDTYDKELCSKSCFWLRTNRPSANHPHTQTLGKMENLPAEDLAIVRKLLTIYGGERRGPCLITPIFCGKYLCSEVFSMMLWETKNLKRSQKRLKSAFKQQQPQPALIKKQFTVDYWRDQKFANMPSVDRRETFYPCHHDGQTCEQARCSCYKKGIACEKTCGCPADCSRRFRGCSCARVGKPCFKNNDCPCYFLNRECDADLCSACGADVVLDPENRYKEDASMSACCRNVSIQRSIPKRLLLGKSRVSGFGIFAGEQIKKNDYIEEYQGEVISSEEAQRRDITYQHRETTYLFDLSDDQVLDGMHAGNKTRYINHSNRNNNVYPKLMLCNTIARLGLFAKRDMEAGEELLFDYGPKFTQNKSLVELDPVLGTKMLASNKSRSTAEMAAASPRPPKQHYTASKAQISAKSKDAATSHSMSLPSRPAPTVSTPVKVVPSPQRNGRKRARSASVKSEGSSASSSSLMREAGRRKRAVSEDEDMMDLDVPVEVPPSDSDDGDYVDDRDVRGRGRLRNGRKRVRSSSC